MRGFRLSLLVLLINFSCGEKKQEHPADQPEDSVTIASAAITFDQESAYDPEIFEYRSTSLKDYQLYAIYLFQDAPQFIMVKNDEARLLKLNEEKEIEEGQALDDEEFVEAKFLQETEADGMTTFEQIELTTRADLNVVFNHSQTKRSLTIGSEYGYVGEDISGKLRFEQAGEVYNFSVSIDDEGHCKLKGPVRIKGNIGYFQGQPTGTACKLIFFFTEKIVRIFSIPSTCGCGKQVSLNNKFFWK